MQADGLFALIKRGDLSAQELIDTGDVSDILFRNLRREIEENYTRVHTLGDHSRPVYDTPMAAVLTIFRFLKRFSPVGADKLHAETIKSFVAGQHRIHQLQRHYFTYEYIAHHVEYVISTLPWDDIMRDIRSICGDPARLQLTHGVGYDSRANVASKLLALSESYPEFFYEPFGIPVAGCVPTREVETYGAYGDEVHRVRLQTVPKNYKSSRMIAMEDTYRQSLSRAVSDAIARHLPSCIDIHDQTRNQQLACLGSLLGLLATLDLHAASDSVAWAFIQRVFPADFVAFLRLVRPTHFNVAGKDKLIAAFATMGHSLTFVVETIAFWAIARAATDYFQLLTGSSIDDDTVSAYGDDIICPTDAAPLVIEWLQKFGFIVNVEKSFFSHSGVYRESCGEEYYLGANVSSLYYPRFPISGSWTKQGIQLDDRALRDSYSDTYSDATMRVVELQHKLVGVADMASLFLSEVVHEAQPRMTSSPVGTPSSDLWDFEERPVPGRVPLGEFEVTRSSYLMPQQRKLVKKTDPTKLKDRHLTPVVTFKQDLPDSELARAKRLYEIFRYQQFLQHGPSYDDSVIVALGDHERTLGEILRVTSRPSSFKEVSGRPVINWVLA
jgi:hypothetical protein